MENQKVWNNILSEFKKQITASTFKTWFGGSYVLDFKDDGAKKLLVVAVRNNFIKEQINARYTSELVLAGEKLGFGDLEIVFVVSQKEKPTSNKLEPLFSGEPQTLNLRTRTGSSLNPSHSFENFVVSFSNNLAYLGATQVAGNLGSSYNPLFLYGPTGVGKTHLLQAIGNEALKKTIDAKVLYATAEKFTNDFLDSLRNKTQEAFRYKYRSVDLLLVDDVQFLAGKEGTQDEFFHTFNELYLSGRQLVLVSDRHPKELGRLKERLVSRFLGGLACDIGVPDLEMKVAILKAKCQEKSVELGDDVLSSLAQSSYGSVRELEGMLVAAITSAKLSGGKIEAGNLERIIATNQRIQEPLPTPGKIIDLVSRHFKVSHDALCDSSRKAGLVRARQVLIFLLRKELGLPLEAIGQLVGGRDHSTIIHSIGKIEQMVAVDQDVSDEGSRLRTMLSSS